MYILYFVIGSAAFEFFLAYTQCYHMLSRGYFCVTVCIEGSAVVIVIVERTVIESVMQCRQMLGARSSLVTEALPMPYLPPPQPKRHNLLSQPASL